MFEYTTPNHPESSPIAVSPFETNNEAFFVHTHDKRKCFVVLPFSGCSCPDAKEMNGGESYSAAHDRMKQTSDRCEHETAVQSFKETHHVA